MVQKTFSTGKIIGLVVLGVVIIGVFFVMGTYNSLISLNENAKTAQAGIEAQYQRRFDLIPNLVNTAKGIGDLEQTVFENLANARARYSGAAAGSNERVSAMNQFNSDLSRLLVVVENYPQLKSSENFLKLQDQLEGTENRISTSRIAYNDAVNTLNKKIQYFPSNIIAKMFNFSERIRFEATPQAQVAPKVEFNFDNSAPASVTK